MRGARTATKLYHSRFLFSLSLPLPLPAPQGKLQLYHLEANTLCPVG